MPIPILFDFERRFIPVNGYPPNLAHVYANDPPAPGWGFRFCAATEAKERTVDSRGPVDRILYKIDEGFYVAVKHDPETGHVIGRIVGEEEAAGFRRKVTAQRRMSLPQREMTILEALADEHPTALTQNDLEHPTKFCAKTIGRYLAKLLAKQLVYLPGGPRMGYGITPAGLKAIGRRSL